MNEKVKKLLFFFGLTLIAIIVARLGAKYSQGFYFLIGIAFLVFIVSSGKTEYLVYLLALSFWIPKKFNYLFLEGILAEARLPEVMVYGVVFLYLISRLLKRNKAILKIPFAKALGLFFLGSLISFFIDFSPGNVVGYVLFRRGIIYGILTFIATLNFIKTKNQADRALVCLIIGISVFTAVAFYQLYLSPFGIHKFLGHRLGGTFVIQKREAVSATCMAIGGQIAILMPLACAWYLMAEKRYLRIIGLLSLLSLALPLIATFTRSAWISAMFGILAAIVSCIKFKAAKVAGRIRTLAYMVVLLIIFYIILTQTIISNQALVARFESLKYALEDFSLLTRVEAWKQGFFAFLGHPFGMGFRNIYPLPGLKGYPHSLYIGTLLSSGLIGAIGFFSLLASLAKKISLSLKKEESEKYLLIGALGSLSAFLFFGIFENNILIPNMVMIPLWLILGVATARSYSFFNQQEKK